jgi:type IV pilus assembly protein PilF
MKKIINIQILIIVFPFIIFACSPTNKIRDNADAHYKLGLSYLDANEDAIAMKEFNRALSMKPNDAKVYYAIATFYLKKNQIDMAKSNILKALNIEPENSEYLNTYASILAVQGNQKEALKVWEKVEKDPTYPSIGIVYFNMGYAYSQLGLNDKAIGYLNKSIDENPNVIRPYIFLYNLFLSMNELSKAEEVLKRGINRNPLSPILKMELAMFYYNRGLFENAAILFNDIIDVSPNSDEAAKAKAYLKNMGLYYE